MKDLKVFTCSDHDGHYPVGTASVIVAKDKQYARRLLNKSLKSAGLKQSPEKPFTLNELDTTEAGVTTLCDGNY